MKLTTHIELEPLPEAAVDIKRRRNEAILWILESFWKGVGTTMRSGRQYSEAKVEAAHVMT